MEKIDKNAQFHIDKSGLLQDELKDKVIQLTDENKDLKTENVHLQMQADELRLKLAWYEEQFRLSQHKRFGKSSEQSEDDSEQLGIFNEVEVCSDPKAEEPELEEVVVSKRKKQKGHKDEQLKDLPKEVITYTLSEEERECPQCRNELSKMKTEIRRELEIIPAQVKVIEHEKTVYACRNCQQNDITTPIISAPTPKALIAKSIATPSLVAYIMVSKYQFALPLDRQEQQFENYGISLSKNTMSNWVMKCAQDYLGVIYGRLYMYLLKSDIANADETTLQVLHEDGRQASSKSYMWLYMSGKESEHQIALYDYQTTRASKHPQRFLKGYIGYLHTDGYGGYDTLNADIKICCCFAHVRRKFHECIKAMPKDSKHTPIAKAGFDYCNRLYKIEHQLAGCDSRERYEKRLLKSQPVLEEFLSWLNVEDKKALPKSKLKEATGYAKNQWKKLCRFLEDGRLEIDNNRAERCIKSFVIGRKNWMFSNTSKGAKSSATVYSIIETAKLNGLNSFEYLKYIFEEMKEIDLSGVDANPEQIDHLLPWSDTLPEICRLKEKGQDQTPDNLSEEKK